MKFSSLAPSLLFATIITSSSAFLPSFSHSHSTVSQAWKKKSDDSFSTQLQSSEESSNDDFMASLQQRINQVEKRENKVPLVILDCMLPRQLMKIQVKNPLLMELVRTQMEKENPTFGMLGMAILTTGEKINLTTGVEVELLEKPVFIDEGVLMVLKAGRRFMITGEVDNTEQGWTEARVKYLDFQEQEEEEVRKSDDRMAVARAIMKAKELTTPNANMVNNVSLVDRWIELARENEKRPEQIDELLEELGEIPPEDEPSERALWVGALINPLPSLGVAMEIRPALLTATTAEKRVEIVCEGILKSIRHMDGTSKMW
jgi:Lon protease-like protein